MTLEMISIRRLIPILCSIFAVIIVITSLAAAQNPSPALLVTTRGKGAHAVQIVDPMTMKVVASVPVARGGAPHELSVSADGRFAFVTVNNQMLPDSYSEVLHGGDYISVVDLAARKEVRHVETGPGSIPHGMVFAGGKLYFTAEGYQLVARYDPASNKIDWMCGTGQGRTHMLVMTKDTKRIFTANTDSNSVSAIVSWDSPAGYERIQSDPPPLWDVTAIPVGHGPEGITMSPDEKEVWVTTRGDGGVSIIDVATKKVSETLDLKTRTPLRPEFTPDGKRVIIADNLDGEILIMDAVNRREIKRIDLGNQKKDFEIVMGVPMLHGVRIVPKIRISNLMITPDGSRAYISIMSSNNVAILDLKTLEITGRISTASEPQGMAWVETKY